MFALLMLTTVGVALCGNIPPPRIKYLPSGELEIAVQGDTSLKVKYARYGTSKDKSTHKMGPFHLAVDGDWYHRSHNVDMKPHSVLYYTVAGETPYGDMEYLHGTWSQEHDQFAVAPPERLRRAGRVVFRDDFSQARLSTTDWDYEVSMYGGYNWEIQVYTNDQANVFIRNGHLYLKPTLTVDDNRFDEHYLTHGVMDVAALWGHCTNSDRYGCHREGKNGLLPPVMSGKIKSKHTIKYGKVEVRAKIPKGDWLWPAIWMLPRNSVYGGWPQSGEMDIMESRGNTEARDGSGRNDGVNRVGSTLHWGSDAAHNRYATTMASRNNDRLWSSDFHIYTLDWTADHITISVDDNVILNVPTPHESFWNHGHFPGHNIWASGGKNAPFDTPFYLILNVAVGGTNGFFPDNWRYNSPKPWQNTSPTESADFWNRRADWQGSWVGDDVAMIIDYVQMTQY